MNVREIFDNYYNGDKNFMTPNVYGYAKKKFGKEYLVFEKSQGEGLFDSPLYGCSTLVHNPETGETQKIELSECFDDPRYVEVHINGITKSKFENADRYGEIKRC